MSYKEHLTFNSDVIVYFWTQPPTLLFYSNEKCLESLRVNQIDFQKHWFAKYTLHFQEDLHFNYVVAGQVHCENMVDDCPLSITETCRRVFGEDSSCMEKKDSWWPRPTRITIGDVIQVNNRHFVIVSPGPAFPYGIAELIFDFAKKRFVCK